MLRTMAFGRKFVSIARSLNNKKIVFDIRRYANAANLSSDNITKNIIIDPAELVLLTSQLIK